MVKEFKASTGADIVVTEAPFKDAMRLKNTILREIGDVKFNVSFVDSSEPIYFALWPCLIRCTYNGEKITELLFDQKPEAREDYYEVINACVEENLRPFMKGFDILSKKAEQATNTDTPITK